MPGNLGCSCGGRGTGPQGGNGQLPWLIVGRGYGHLFLDRLNTEPSTSAILGGRHIPIILFLGMRNAGTCCELAQGRTQATRMKVICQAAMVPNSTPFKGRENQATFQNLEFSRKTKKKMQRWTKGKHLPLLLSSSPLPTDPGCHCESCPLPCISGQHMLAVPAGNASHGLCPTQQLTTRPHPSEIHCRDSLPLRLTPQALRGHLCHCPAKWRCPTLSSSPVPEVEDRTPKTYIMLGAVRTAPNYLIKCPRLGSE